MRKQLLAKKIKIIETDKKENQGFFLNSEYMNKIDKNWIKKLK